MATLFSFLVAAFLFFYPQSSTTVPMIPYISLPIVLIASLFLLLMPIMNVLLFRALAKMSWHYSPLVMEWFRRDHLFQFLNLLIVTFTILSLAVAMNPEAIPIGNTTLLLVCWVVLLGIVVDSTWFLLRRGLHYLSAPRFAELCAHQGIRGAQEGKNEKVWESLNGLTETALGGMKSASLALSAACVDHLQDVIHHFLRSYQSIGHLQSREEIQGKDEVSYTLFFLLQRMELLAVKAIEETNEPLVSDILTAMAKIVVYCAHFDLSLTTYPLHSMRTITEKAIRQNMKDPPVKTTCSLVEVAKAIPEEVDITYLELQPTYFSLISTLEKTSKESFRRDKSLPFPILRQPFEDLKEILEKEPMKSHQDAAAIGKDIARVLDEFATLETVMHTLPSLSEAETKKGEEAPQS